ncbi:nipped-B protein isoform X1 [Vanessa tameamea]|uniref:Nipped-B protein n=1 Tax=Vanessa tameamea TaxID=334116 RepID=A0A8B8IDB6_VANTA|nr:nipped-B protein isoform X1 [Vanessa tameamea]XP_026495045.1 nipped-B protein isoform X1 [Vanessa tameamea]
MNERDIPSVPITTLAGVASLTDLLPVLPLPTPLPSTLNNKSQLFHPRVAEEAAILLATRDDNLVSLLLQSLMQTSVQHIDLKDESIPNAVSPAPQQTTPELLKAILHVNPNVFDQQQRNHWGNNHLHTSKFNGMSPSSTYNYASHNTVHSSPSSHGTSIHSASIPNQQLIAPPCQSSPHVNIGSPPSQARPGSQVNITAQNNVSPPWNTSNQSNIYTSPLSNASNPQNGGYYNSLVQDSRSFGTNISEDKDPLSISPSNMTDQQKQLMQSQDKTYEQDGNVVTGQSPAQASVAPSPLRHEPQVPQPSMGAPYAPPPMIQNTTQEKQDPNRSTTFMNSRYPVVKLGRLSEGILKKHEMPNEERMRKNSTAESDSDDNQPLKAKSSNSTPAVDKDKEAIDIAREKNWEAVKRKHEEASKKEEAEAAIVRPKLRKVERRLVPVLEMLSVDELMETNTYQRFNKLIESVFETIDDDIIVTDEMEGTDIPEDMLLPRYQLQELCAEAAKLKNLGAMEAIPADRLVRLLSILEKNIRAAEKMSLIGDPEDSEEMRQIWIESALDRVMCASDSSLTALYIMTSPSMPKRIFLEDVIDRIIMFIKFQLNNTIYCVYDPVYSIQSTSKKKVDGRKRRGGGAGGASKRGGNSTRAVRELYTHAHECVTLLAELFAAHHLTDTTVLHASTVGVSPFFVENISELQLSALKLVTTIFTKYEQHRRLLLEDILASIARIPSSKHNLRSFQLSSNQHIQMLTALVLQLVQSVVTLPETLCKSNDKEKDKEHSESDNKKHVDKDLMIISKYEAAISVGGTFLTSFLNKCRSRSEEVDFRPLFENFVHDLLTTVNKPEWPATELLLSLLGTMLVKYMSDKSMEMPVRVASLEYLGLVASRLRRDSVTSRAKLATMDAVVRDIRAEEEKDGCQQQSLTSGLDEDEERTEFLQRVLLDYLAINGQKDQAWNCARHFYITQWYRDMVVQPKNSSPTKRPKHKSKKKHKEESSDEESDPDDDSDGGIKESKKHVSSAIMSAEKFKTIERRKNFFLEKIRPFRYQGGTQVQVMQSYIDYSGAELISQYLASKRSFSQSFDRYLRKILVILCENTIAIRTKAMKCLTMIVEADPAVLARPDMKIGVNRSFLDQSTAVREAAVDLVGKFVLSRPDLIDKYYEMLSNRILDTGVSVRKRVIKILKDICIECPEFPKIPEICVKMIRRVNDEEGIRKLVMEVFQNMWFSPCPNSARHGALDITAATADPLTRKVLNITDVVVSSRDMGLEWFQQLLMSLFKPKEDKDDSTKIIYQPPKSLLVACQQIVDCLIEHLLQLEETNTDGMGSSQRILACLSTLHLFAKIRPQLLVNHALTLQPYLSLKCQNQYEQQIMSTVASTLELVVPLMEHPSEVFLAQLEEDAVKLILQHGQLVIASCIACLAAIVNNLTHNYKLIRDVFNKYHGVLLQWKHSWQRNPDMTRTLHTRPHFRRALFIVGLLLRYFDFTDSKVIEGLTSDIKEQVFATLMYFVGLEDEDFVSHTLKALGSVCVRHYEFMLRPELKEFYHQLLTSELAPIEMKADVLRNIEMYLQEEEQRMIRQDKEWSKRSKHENLKEMGDVSSGMASTVIQLYLKEILGSFLHASTVVRSSAMKVVQLVLAQGLVHPVQIVPYLICMSTDTEVTVSHTADKNLQEIDKKYPGFIHMKAQLGIKLSYQLQKILQKSKKGVIRGFRKKDLDDLPTALNGFLYSLLRNTRPQRRALILSLLKQFDDVSTAPLDQMLYLADNLSYFPYQVQDEPLFIIHHIDIIISTSGSNLLQLFREGLDKTGSEEKESMEEEEDEEEEAEALVARLPLTTRPLRDAMRQARGCLLLLVLKQHLKQLYGFTDAKINQYSPSESVKVYEKAVSRRLAPQFEPKATIAQLQDTNDEQELDERGRRRLVDDYLEFKQLMLKFDPEEEEDEDAAAGAAPAPASGGGGGGAAGAAGGGAGAT